MRFRRLRSCHHWHPRQPAHTKVQGRAERPRPASRRSRARCAGRACRAGGCGIRYGEGRVGPRAPQRNAVDPAIHHVLREDPRFLNVEVRAYGWNMTYSAAGYCKLMLSYSSIQMMTPQARQGLLDDVENFVRQQFDNQVTRPIVVTLTTARVT